MYFPLTDGSVRILSFNVLLAFFVASSMSLSQIRLASLPRPPTGRYCGFFFRSESLSPYTTWLATISDTDVLLAEWGTGGVVTVDMGGRIRLWETGLAHLQRSLTEWRNLIGQDDRHLQVRSGRPRLSRLRVWLQVPQSGERPAPRLTCSARTAKVNFELRKKTNLLHLESEKVKMPLFFPVSAVSA